MHVPCPLCQNDCRRLQTGVEAPPSENESRGVAPIQNPGWFGLSAGVRAYRSSVSTLLRQLGYERLAGIAEVQ